MEAIQNKNMKPLLEDNAKGLNYGELPEVWRVPEIERFSLRKTLYDYQRDALENAARALYRFYGEEKAWRLGESPRANRDRKRRFVQSVYAGHTIMPFEIKEYENEADRRNPVFKILSEYMDPQGDAIYYYQLINRMCFWMATGSGKTLVMVKIIEYLRHLKERQQIPPHNILVLAPSEHLIKQIRLTIEEFNEEGLNIDLVPLREFGKTRQARLGDVETVYYHRSDNLSDVQKDALTDYRLYENGGKWFVLLDEAHKGGKEDSKRQAYYALMAREGFLFNFSATFTDEEDIVTTVKKYNLQEFIQNGHGKNIYLNESEYRAFKNRGKEVGGEKKKQIVLKSLITLAHASRQVARLRQDTGNDEIYHLPLMLTLVNSVNTNIEDDSNDLWVFFQVLRQIAEGGIDETLFNAARDELLQDWRGAQLLFGGGGKADEETLIGDDPASVENMTISDLREKVFLSRRQGRLQIIRGKESDKELAFQLINADRPFAMFRIGDTSRWRNEFLVGFEETTALQEQGFFDSLETSDITILMGSRAFFESWDSKRPNIINFINIGGSDAKKFVVQAVGRGVRIEPLPNERRRLGSLAPQKQGVLQDCAGKVGPLETLFLFATNRNAINSVLDGMDAERGSNYERVTGFKRAKRPEVNGKEMPLLVPEYQQEADKRVKTKFTLGENTLARFRRWLDNTPDSVFVVRDGLTPQQINSLREEVKERDNFRINQDKEYDSLPFLQERLLSHLSVNAQTAKGMRALNEQEGNEDIVHFREVRANLGSQALETLNEKIKKVAQGRVEGDEYNSLLRKHLEGEISRDEFEAYTQGQPEASFDERLKIKHVAAHYYLPMVTASEPAKADFIKHIVKVESEVTFLNALDEWLQGEGNTPQWDAWMFSKLDESLDKVHIPYFDGKVNEYRRFLPDFVFWMCKDDQYQIVFVDPKGVAHASSYHKIDGYEALFEEQGQCREFSTRFPLAKNVKVKLLLFNPDPDQSPSRKYARYWRDHGHPEAVFD